MQRLIIIAACFASLLNSAPAQGVFFGSNAFARTRIGSLDGPLAGTNIFGQYFAGPTPDSLVPLSMAIPHGAGGTFFSGHATVPSLPPYEVAYVQLVVWDGTMWGSDWTAVPTDQIGRTDIVPVILTTGVFPDVLFYPQFTQPAIVPVPEPAGWALLALTGGTLLLAGRRNRRPSP